MEAKPAYANTMAWIAKYFPDLAENVRTGRTDFVEAYVEAVKRAIQNAP